LRPHDQVATDSLNATAQKAHLNPGQRQGSSSTQSAASSSTGTIQLTKVEPAVPEGSFDGEIQSPPGDGGLHHL